MKTNLPIPGVIAGLPAAALGVYLVHRWEALSHSVLHRALGQASASYPETYDSHGTVVFVSGAEQLALVAGPVAIFIAGILLYASLYSMLWLVFFRKREEAG